MFLLLILFWPALCLPYPAFRFFAFVGYSFFYRTCLVSLRSKKFGHLMFDIFLCFSSVRRLFCNIWQFGFRILPKMSQLAPKSCEACVFSFWVVLAMFIDHICSAVGWYFVSLSLSLCISPSPFLATSFCMQCSGATTTQMLMMVYGDANDNDVLLLLLFCTQR